MPQNVTKCKEVRKVAKQNCQECHTRLRNADCQHMDSERAITGLWTRGKIEKALEKGYKIEKIYDVWHFEQSSADLWKGYIKKFMKIKLKNSKFTG
jgi:nucleotidyltransferase/DNA polymerase involved in DNA repair